MVVTAAYSQSKQATKHSRSHEFPHAHKLTELTTSATYGAVLVEVHVISTLQVAHSPKDKECGIPHE